MLQKKTVTKFKTVTIKKRVKVKRSVWVLEPCYIRLGKAIVEARVEVGMTQGQLAQKIGISRPSLANMELGRQRILLHHLFMIEKALGVYNVLINIARGRNTA